MPVFLHPHGRSSASTRSSIPRLQPHGVMSLSRRFFAGLIGLGFVMLMAGPAGAQPVQVAPTPGASLVERWAWAKQEAKAMSAATYWTGYRIERRVRGDQTIVIGGIARTYGPTYRRPLPLDTFTPSHIPLLHAARTPAGQRVG